MPLSVLSLLCCQLLRRHRLTAFSIKERNSKRVGSFDQSFGSSPIGLAESQ
jgi:hypothetical protein